MSGKEAKNLVTETKDYVVSAIEGVGDLSVAVVDAVSSILVRTTKGTRISSNESLGFVVDTVTGAVHGVAEVGCDIGDAAKYIMVGAISGTRQVGKVGVEAVSASAAALVKSAFEIGGSVGDAAVGAMEGAIESAREVGVTAEEAATAAATGAIQAAGEISTAALNQVRNVVTHTISGVEAVIEVPFRYEADRTPSAYPHSVYRRTPYPRPA